MIRRLHKAGHQALLAGGCVRDMILNRAAKDYDVATNARPKEVIRLFARTRKIGAKFGVVMVLDGNQQVEVATFRTESGYADGRHPDKVEFATAKADAARRDFTINGMFYDVVDDSVIDYVGGQEDLQGRRIRAIGDAEQRFTEDHLRMLRAVRFAARLGFDIEPGTFEALKRHAHAIRSIAPERVRLELELILTASSRARGWEMLVSSGLADHLAEGVTWTEAQASEAGWRLADLPEDAGFTLALAAVLITHGPQKAQTACRRLTCANVNTKGVGWLLTQLPRVAKPDRLELADIKLLMANPLFDDLGHLLRSELIAASQPLEAHAALLSRAAEIPSDQVTPPPLVTGDDLLALNVAQGPAYARILEILYRAQLNMEIVDRTTALDRLKELVKDL
ncbi:MAG: CCA tRNA nucleotidyltransferase [Planctomycetes bacterium]|nr:CCA tRNA nucleotidyltransferase [Planctomycetota bacterium]